MNYNNGLYCATCSFQDHISVGRGWCRICTNFHSQHYGKPRNRKTRDGQKWLQRCLWYATSRQMQTKYNAHQKLREKIADSFAR